MKKLWDVMVILGILAALFFGADWLFRHSVKIPYSYCLESKFDQLPDDDERLTEWIKQEDGVVPSTVHVRRFDKKDGVLLEIGFVQAHTLAGDPPFPDLDGKC